MNLLIHRSSAAYNVIFKLLLVSVVSLFLFGTLPSRVFAETTLFTETFSGANGQELTSYNPQWTPRIPELANSKIQSNELLNTGNNSSYYYSPFVNLIDVCVATSFHSDWTSLSFVSLETRRSVNGLNLYIASIDNKNSYSIGKDFVPIKSGSVPGGELDTGIHSVKFCSIGSLHTFYLDNIALDSFTDSTYSSGYVGFDTSTGMYIDNFSIISPSQNQKLNVSYLSQNSPQWGAKEYDSAKTLGFKPASIDRWGCAITSIAMILKFHGINQLPNGVNIDPGTLNDWLKVNNGFMTGSGSGGSYSYLNWEKVSILTKAIFEAGKSSIKLEHHMVRNVPLATLKAVLSDDLNLGNSFGKFPDILKVSNSQTTSHFVVATGDVDEAIYINDPEWNYPNLSSFNNTFTQINRFVPSNTNLSSMHIVINPNIEILVTDPFGRRIGKSGEGQIFNEISNASYGFSQPINNLGTGDQELGIGVNDLWIDEPVEGKYLISLSSSSRSYYTINIMTAQQGGDSQLKTSIGNLNLGDKDEFLIDYRLNFPSQSSKVVSFDSTVQDIRNAKALRQIDAITEIAFLTAVKTSENFYNKHQYSNSLKALRVFSELNEKLKGSLIKLPAYQAFSEDAEGLKVLINAH